MLVIVYLITAASSREAALVDHNHSAWENLWGHTSARDTLADTFVGIVCAPVSDETLESLKQEGRSTGATETRA